MNLILVPHHPAAPVRSLRLSRFSLSLLAVIVTGGLSSTAFLVFLLFSGGLYRAPAAGPTAAVEQPSLNALAVHIGKMQAQLARLDALGARLAETAGMQDSHFKAVPAQGGPALSTTPISVESLGARLQTLGHGVGAQADRLEVLEILLPERRALDGLRLSHLPVDTPWSSSNFGPRIDPFSGKIALHEGMDFPAKAGTPIVAAADGVVVHSGYDAEYGQRIDLRHKNNVVTRYAHAAKRLVKVGQLVRKGQKIATVGSTGRSTGPHLHFEVRVGGHAKNPIAYLKTRTGG